MPNNFAAKRIYLRNIYKSVNYAMMHIFLVNTLAFSYIIIIVHFSLFWGNPELFCTWSNVLLLFVIRTWSSIQEIFVVEEIPDFTSAGELFHSVHSS